jgi:Protein of unknown function (DUF2911)
MSDRTITAGTGDGRAAPPARSVLHGVVVAAAVAVYALPARAQAPSAGAFVARLGSDTVAVEQYTFDGRELRGTGVVRAPRVRLWSYAAALDPVGEVTRFRLSSGPPGAPSAQVGTYSYTADSVVIEIRHDSATRTLRLAACGRPLPFTPYLFGPWELALHQAHIGAGGTTVTMLSGRQVLAYTVQSAAPGDLDLEIGDADYGPLHARLDARGRLESFDLRQTTDKYVAERVTSIDVQARAAAYAAQEQAGRGLGTLSPRDTASATIGAARVLVDYGRPSVRGRVIFGNVVPWGVVWRTGANEATQLVTDRDLEIGGTTVPAGTYSLFTIPTPHGWTLIINRQHGQWGTEYHAEQDLAQLDMTTRTLPNVVERLTAALRPGGDGGELAFSWDRTEATIEFRVK